MSSHDTSNPTGGVAMGHPVESANPDENLLDRMLSRENMLKAWKQVKANKGASGIDGMTIEALLEFARDHWGASVIRSLTAPTHPYRSAGWKFQKQRVAPARWGFPLYWTD